MSDELARFGVSVEAKLLEEFDRLIERKGYASRSEALRDLMRDYLVENRIEDPSSDVIGTIALVYNHRVRELSDRLVSMQHEFHTGVVSAMHVHLDHDNCLEVMVVKGRVDQVRSMADRLISTKGVKHGKLFMTSV